MPSRRKSTPAFQFDPHSLNATLATIIAEQKQTREEMRGCFGDVKVELVAVKEQVIKTNGRVGVLELWRETSSAKRAGFAAAFGVIGGVIAWSVNILAT